MRQKFTQIIYGIIAQYQPRYFPIAYKLALILTLMITFGMGLLAIIIVSNQTRIMTQQINAFGQTSVSQLGESSKELILSDDQLSLMVVNNNLGNSKNVLGTVVYSDNGKILAATGIYPGEDIIQIYAQSTSLDEENYRVEWVSESTDGAIIEVISFISPIRFQNVIAGHALVSFGKAHLSKALYSTVLTIAAVTLFMIVIGAFIAIYLGKRMSKPIHQLMDASIAIGSGQYDHKIVERRNDEIGYLTTAFNKMATDLLEKSQVENAFSRFVSTSVAKQIMANLDHVQLGGTHIEATALFADIVGFTSFSENRAPEEVAALLNEYFSYINMACQLYKGTLDKYMGDCAMLIFGVPEEDPDHKFNAIACAVMIQKMVALINAKRIRQAKPAIHFRIGINSGTMLAGNMGSPDRMQYTVVGEAVNLASRLHTVAEKDQIIVTDLLYHDVDVEWRVYANKYKQIKLRGIKEAVSTYIIQDVRDSFSATIDAQIAEIFNEDIPSISSIVS
jgi:adenylate cyclase